MTRRRSRSERGAEGAAQVPRRPVRAAGQSRKRWSACFRRRRSTRRGCSPQVDRILALEKDIKKMQVSPSRENQEHADPGATGEAHRDPEGGRKVRLRVPVVALWPSDARRTGPAGMSPAIPSSERGRGHGRASRSDGPPPEIVFLTAPGIPGGGLVQELFTINLDGSGLTPDHARWPEQISSALLPRREAAVLHEVPGGPGTTMPTRRRTS